MVIEVGAPQGPYRPAPRDLVLSVVSDQEPKRVLVGTEPLLRLSPGELAAAPRGFAVAEGAVTVKMPDRFEAVKVTLER